MKQEPLSLNLTKTIMVVTIFVCFGALIGAIGYLAMKSKTEPPVLPPVEKEESKIDTSDWKIYNNPETDFTFKYPNNWEVKQDYLYKTAAGVEAESRTVILGPIGDKRSEIININVPQIATGYNPNICEFKELCRGNYIVTCKKEPEILEVYHLIINSFKCIEDETAVIGIPDRIIISSPRPNEIISSPIVVSGKARGFWFFEGEFLVSVYDDNGELLGGDLALFVPSFEGEEWMTENFVNFEGTIKFTTPSVKTGYIIFAKSNPSDRRELDESYKLPIKFQTDETADWKLIGMRSMGLR